MKVSPSPTAPGSGAPAAGRMWMASPPGGAGAMQDAESLMASSGGPGLPPQYGYFGNRPQAPGLLLNSVVFILYKIIAFCGKTTD